MNIRPEKESDIPAIRHVHAEAFRVHPFSRQTEHFIVEHLRKAGALSISLVAETEDGVAGHIAFSRALIGGNDAGWFLLGPVGVLPALQRKGIGSALVREGLAALRNLDAAGCILVGDPHFYERFGFASLPQITMPEVPQEYVLSLPFGKEIPSGILGHHEAFLATE